MNYIFKNLVFEGGEAKGISYFVTGDSSLSQT